MMMTGSPHILIVDDHREIRDALAKYLEKNGMRATDAANALLKVGQFDLIVLDVMMPGEDGLSVCRRLRAQGGIPILMLTALGMIPTASLDLRLGPMTICRNHSIRASSWPGSRQSCGGPNGRGCRAATLPGTGWRSTDGFWIPTGD
ncbi:CheY-like chemotaxis protein [Aminobacter ciceronei]|uniref:CheY-like chemotaxis protein n=2 Tax=Aminobacter ciceronei TaxID=150723 RepID=A0ABR6C0H9_9HYPH|nr:CheY-like chemotaxis protein [Aminobacter ciceronei]MBA9018473.1 CheY-like chemotaxis protein [Aminobacter ciceronei]